MTKLKKRKPFQLSCVLISKTRRLIQTISFGFFSRYAISLTKQLLLFDFFSFFFFSRFFDIDLLFLLFSMLVHINDLIMQVRLHWSRVKCSLLSFFTWLFLIDKI